ncbi:MAG: biopolymer transporter ExbD [Spirochaetales bacterium]|nr:biopolymer transporter ExbD [Spirochaetales bacterium]HPO03343.1 biopolymer transporter ExbD [Treponemataceae bacterium]
MIRLPERRKIDDPGSSGALNDLSFILIIFFIVIAGFNINKGFLLTLPDAERPRIVQTDDLVKCRIDAAGTVSIDGNALSVEKLENLLVEKKAKWPNMTFLLIIDEDCAWEHVVRVIHEVRKLRIENFSFKMDGERR